MSLHFANIQCPIPRVTKHLHFYLSLVNLYIDLLFFFFFYQNLTLNLNSNMVLSVVSLTLFSYTEFIMGHFEGLVL